MSVYEREDRRFWIKLKTELMRPRVPDPWWEIYQGHPLGCPLRSPFLSLRRPVGEQIQAAGDTHWDQKEVQVWELDQRFPRQNA